MTINQISEKDVHANRFKEEDCHAFSENDKDGHITFEVHDWQQVNAVATDYVSKTILGIQNISEQMKFVSQIRELFENSIRPSFFKDSRITQYNLSDDDVLFLFKGGNVMRFFMHTLTVQNPEAYQEFLQKYKNYHSVSDLDFGVHINFNKIEKSQHKNVVHILSNYTEIGLRRFRSKVTKYLDNFNAQDLKKILMTMNTKAKEKPLQEKGISIHELHSMNTQSTLNEGMAGAIMVPDETRRKDFSVFDENGNKLCYDTNSDLNSLYVSNNQTLNFGNVKTKKHFDLVRMKMNFSVKYKIHDGEQLHTKLIGGEE